MFNVIAFPPPFTLWVFSWWGVTIPHTLACIIGLQKNLFASPCAFSNRKRHPVIYWMPQIESCPLWYFAAYTYGVTNKKVGVGRRQFPSKIKPRNITYTAEWRYGNTGVDLALDNLEKKKCREYYFFMISDIQSMLDFLWYILQYDSDNLLYEKVEKNEPVCITDEVPFDI